MSGPQPSASESSAGGDSDQDFDPSADMLVNDFDDEHTLDEEEAISDELNGEEEIDDLQKEGEMPLEELMALYGYGTAEKVGSSSDKSVERAEATSTTPTETNSLQASELHSNSNQMHSNASQLIGVSHLRSSQPFTHMNNQNMVSDSSDDESDDDFSANEEDWRRTIQVGSDYQASIPEGLSRYDGAPAYENEDRLLWNPSFLTDKDIEEYLTKFSQSEEANADEVVVSSTLTLPTGSHIRDDEQALYLLHQCGHNVEEAIRRKRTTPNLPAVNESMSSWSEEECKAFEAGLRSYGKDFHLVQQNKVRTRSVGELVQFYYLWKKTERHDVFATKFRVEKKKYSLHPGTTDYMDRFLDEQENMALTNMSSSSSSLNNMMSSNKQQLLHPSFRSSPSTQTLTLGPHKSDHILLDDLSTHYANINSLCDSGGGTNASHISGATIGSYVNGYYKKSSDTSSDSVLCSVGGGGVVGAGKVCHSVNSHHNNNAPHLTSDWVAQQQQSVTTSSTTTATGPVIAVELGPEFIRRAPISSTTLINDNKINSNSNNTNTTNSG